ATFIRSLRDKSSDYVGQASRRYRRTASFTHYSPGNAVIAVNADNGKRRTPSVKRGANSCHLQPAALFNVLITDHRLRHTT
ncbi:MAG TPA: hypothetical protein VHS80_01985, partial [Chthoniobacterales bacterium]|nr:hypothetical protein [Chthoniobacterales bacterium]